MDQVVQFAQHHWFILFYLGAAMVFNMPEPDATSGKFYRWSYGTLHTLANAGAAKKAWTAVAIASTPSGQSSAVVSSEPVTSSSTPYKME